MEISQLEVEDKIRAIWSVILSLETIEPEQSFFDLGGDSLLVMDMIFQLTQGFGVEIDPALLFEEPTLRGFSGLVGNALLSNAENSQGVI